MRRVTYSTYGGAELRPFVENMLRTADKEVIERPARDQGLIEKFLKDITYEISVATPDATARRYEARMSIGPPGVGTVTTQGPLLLP